MNRWSMLFVLVLAPGTFGGCTTSPGVETRVSLPKTVTTQSVDGVTVHGERYYGQLDATAPLILLFHQGGTNGRAEYSPLARWLNAAGYRALAWEMTRATAAEQRQILESAGVIFRIVENGIHGSSMLVDARTENDMSGTREDVVAWLDDL